MREAPLPSMSEVGLDLLVTTRRQRWIALSRPAIALAVFAVLARAGWWWLTPIAMFALFVSVVTVTHDVVHRSLGLKPRGSDWALFVFGALLLESGHAYRATHLQHHRLFPSPQDPEGYPADLSFVGAVLYGPVFLIRLWVWAWRQSAGQRRQQRWLLAEALVPVFMIAGGVLLWPISAWPALYVLMAVMGSWVYPLLTVYLPHHDYGQTPLTQTRTLRGHLVPAIFLELTYHLEHHLYPQVPSHQLATLSQRLDPVLTSAGVRATRVP